LPKILTSLRLVKLLITVILMYPILLSYGSFLLPSWHTMYAIGAFLALWLFFSLAKLDVPGVAWPQLSRIFAICYVAGYFGARLLSIIIEEPEVIGIQDTLTAMIRFGPMTFYGGALASAFCGGIYAAKHRLPLARLFDCAIPAGLLALSVGRVGCFLNGDDFGKAVPVPNDQVPPFWAVTFPNLGDNIARYPVQLIEAVLSLALCLACVTMLRRNLHREKGGIIAVFGVCGYAITRFFLEFIRDDYRGTIPWTQLSTSQGISLVLMIVSAVTLVRLSRLT